MLIKLKRDTHAMFHHLADDMRMCITIINETKREKSVNEREREKLDKINWIPLKTLRTDGGFEENREKRSINKII